MPRKRNGRGVNPAAAWNLENDSTPDSTVRIRHGAITATITGPRRALRLVERALPRTGWSRGVRPDELIITSNRVGDAVKALRAASYRVEEVR